MALYHVLTALAGERAAEALAEALEALDPVATEVRDHDDDSGLWDVGAHFAAPPDAAGLALLANLHGAPDFAVTRVEDRDWVAQVRAELTPVDAGRFVVFGGHDRERIPVNRIGLEIEAAQAFGTGHHATTQGCLIALDRLARRGFAPRSVADIGGGTGVLAMAAVSAWRATAIAGDIDPLATTTACENVAANGFRLGIGCVTAAGFRHTRLRRRYDLVCANILAAPLRALAPQMAAHQPPGGVAVLSGLLARQAAGVLAVYRGWGYRRIDRIPIQDWTTLVLRRG
ncbi:50S ribosomal protein L11 methyltransferase [Amaricoccus sp.]|uniref:50S ribosomal protein L11 methyltransferase n=1 Tax=Amaricoccus sp. TaxID=1872485 RepID=UPI001B597EBB|nr:50S ribosomal protein L11 methyltransferase [Amaricoccus sp.]MBP7242310.1 50S ribosomal protein L11 methyltransferase [Amaricoccus sp.]